MLQAVIFDMDGVIVDSHPAHKRAWKIFFLSLGKEISDDELVFVLEGRKREAILRHFLGDLTPDQVTEYGARKEDLFRNTPTKLTMIHGLPGFLESLDAAALPLALASSASRGRAAYTLEQLDLTRRFRVIVTGDDVQDGKPDPAIFRLAAQRLDVAAKNVLVCEDSVCGVEAAKKAGMKCLAIASPGRGPLLENAGADYVLPDFTSAHLEELHGLFES
jgi:HAD superfamily hydrolase (TIGR01509 family)